MKKKSYNGLLISGILILLSGLALLTYCITSYSEIKLITDKIDFDELDNNNQISTSDKYYKHISIWDTLNQKLEHNKNLPYKNMSCGYLDYAQHNITSLYKLIYKSANEDASRRTVVEGNIKSLLLMYDNYKTCRKTAQYQNELQKILDEIENSEDIFYQGRMETFISGTRDIERINIDSTTETLQDDVFPQYKHEDIEYGQPATYNLQYPTQNNHQIQQPPSQYQQEQPQILQQERQYPPQQQNYQLTQQQNLQQNAPQVRKYQPTQSVQQQMPINNYMPAQ